MKLYCSKILLFVFTLNILVTSSSNVGSHLNNPSITTHHTRSTTSRVLSEGDTESSIYDKDAEIKSVKEIFDRQTSQRFEEYEERMKYKRQKHKEQRDKNIQKIIEKDKMEKSLAEKVEKGCLRCGCALGGGVLPVWGLVSGLWYGTLSQHVTKMAIQKGIEAGIKEGLAQIKIIANTYRGINKFPVITVEQMLSSGKFTNSVTLSDMFEHIFNMYDELVADGYFDFASYVDGIVKNETIDLFNTRNRTLIEAVANAFEKGEAAEAANYTSITSSLTSGITASIIAIVVIVLVLIIIYLILRYRRKKKMKKKAQYTKLLNE
ncbi:rifin PIR protein, putative [Plasmodium reichenowi]|uniref:Rifin PIR protein, putative n=1 Tax=Plasmodium reichenowi TaxID=5854 RepID=A0A2P9DCQ5_PLARE|nr:rifin PIR protein, putative [Plasmodium reichenowi]